jgi:hypothetical protein
MKTVLMCLAILVAFVGCTVQVGSGPACKCCSCASCDCDKCVCCKCGDCGACGDKACCAKACPVKE